jgi:hypothetical protein
MQPLVLGTAQINTTDAAVFTVPAGQIWEITAITLTHPAAGVLKNVAIGFGTTATAANVKWNETLTAGVYRNAFYPGWSLQPAATLNTVASAGANEAIITVSGFKHPIT